MPLVAPDQIETPRLLLRLLQEADLPSLLQMNSDPEVTALLPYATWNSISDGKAWYERMRGIEATGLALQFVVVDRSTAAAIGTCLLFRFEEASARVEIGYALGRQYWGQGLMREGLVALLDCAFTSMRLRRVEAEVNTRNAASAALLARLGFTKEGLLRKRWVTKGQAEDVEVYGLLQGELRPEAPTQRNAVSVEENKAVAFAFFERFSAGDIAGSLDTMTEDATWWIPGKKERSPTAGLYSKERIGRLFRRMVGALKGDLQMDVISCIAESDRVAVEVESRGDLKNGRLYRQQYHMLLTFRNGKISSVREYLDTQHANDVWSMPLTPEEESTA
jgi:RimJ/RimL family protein N-acetyltransferase/ketosteroid isomerase-like protein